jgi:hypothetical protein
MCDFFSFLSDGKGSYIYADAKTRKENPDKEHDAHSWLAQHFLGEGASKLEDLYNKYEYNPLTRELKLDNRGQKCEDDSDSAEKWCNALNFKRIIPELIIKKIKIPLTGRPKKPTKKDIANLKKWSRTGYCVWNSICFNIDMIVRNSVDNSLWFMLDHYVDHNIWCDISRKLLFNRNNINGRCRKGLIRHQYSKHSIMDLVCNYKASFFNLEYNFDITPGNELWNRGFVPCFDGTTWKLHSGKDAKVVYEMKA